MKKIASIILIFAMALSLCACHGHKALPAFEMPESLDTSREFEITFWAKNDTNKAQVNIYQQAAEDFEKLYPNIHVNIRYYTDYTKIYNDVITNIATNTTPNVCISYPDHIATYNTGINIVVPLDELLTYTDGTTDAITKGDIVESFLEECKLGDSYYALPFMRSTEALYINKTYVEALGYTVPDVVTWDFIWEVSEAAAEKNADGTYKLNNSEVMIPFIYKSTDNMMIQWLWQKGAGYSDADGTIKIFNETTKELLLDLASHVEKGAFSTFKISSYPANYLNAGQCVFAVDSTAGSTWMGPDAPLADIPEEDFVDYEIEVRTIPQFNTENQKMISQGPSICIFNKEDPQEVLASWLFARYLLSNSVQIAYSETEGYVPVTYTALNSDEYKEYLSMEGSDEKDHYSVKIQATQLLLDNLDNTFTTPVFNGSASLRDAAGQMIENVTKSIRRKETVDEAYIEELYQSMISLYRLNSISGTHIEE